MFYLFLFKLFFMDRIHAFVSGRVQGVSFRAFAKREADKLGITGIVHNLDDGRVEIIAEGDGDMLVKFTDILRKNHPIAEVDDIEAKWELAKSGFKGFIIMK